MILTLNMFNIRTFGGVISHIKTELPLIHFAAKYENFSLNTITREVNVTENTDNFAGMTRHEGYNHLLSDDTPSKITQVNGTIYDITYGNLIIKNVDLYHNDIKHIWTQLSPNKQNCIISCLPNYDLGKSVHIILNLQTEKYTVIVVPYAQWKWIPYSNSFITIDNGHILEITMDKMTVQTHLKTEPIENMMSHINWNIKGDKCTFIHVIASDGITRKYDVYLIDVSEYPFRRRKLYQSYDYLNKVTWNPDGKTFYGKVDNDTIAVVTGFSVKFINIVSFGDKEKYPNYEIVPVDNFKKLFVYQNVCDTFKKSDANNTTRFTQKPEKHYKYASMLADQSVDFEYYIKCQIVDL